MQGNSQSDDGYTNSFYFKLEEHFSQKSDAQKTL
jgi:hypothetical protein